MNIVQIKPLKYYILSVVGKIYEFLIGARARGHKYYKISPRRSLLKSGGIPPFGKGRLGGI
jgi:hypothetical protein